MPYGLENSSYATFVPTDSTRASKLTHLALASDHHETEETLAKYSKI